MNASTSNGTTAVMSELLTADTAVRVGLTAQQYAWLCRAIDPDRVSRNNKGFSHVEAWDIRRTLTRIFGFCGWDTELKFCNMVWQDITPASGVKGKARYTVVYEACVRLTVKDANGVELAHHEDVATGDGPNQISMSDAYDLAAKTAVSQALKRAAVNIGDQLGLGLYNGGKLDAVIGGSLVNPSNTTVKIPQGEVVLPDPEEEALRAQAAEVSAPAKIREPNAAVIPAQRNARTTPPVTAAKFHSKDPDAVRAEISRVGAARNVSRKGLATSFYDWSKGDQIGEADATALLEYLDVLIAKTGGPQK